MNTPVSEVMESSFPTVDVDASSTEVTKRLQTSPAVLVEEYGRIIGIITRHDVSGSQTEGRWSVANKLPSMAKEEKVLAANRAAFHNYHISDKYEAGIALTGTEVKSAMGGRVQLKEAYVSIRDGEAWLFNAHISPYSHGNRENHEPMRTRKLLLHKREISRLDEATARQGMTLVPTQVYLKNGRIKIEVGIARGKKLYDKREAEMKRTVERETRAQLKERNR